MTSRSLPLLMRGDVWEKLVKYLNQKKFVKQVWDEKCAYERTLILIYSLYIHARCIAFFYWEMFTKII